MLKKKIRFLGQDGTALKGHYDDGKTKFLKRGAEKTIPDEICEERAAQLVADFPKAFEIVSEEAEATEDNPDRDVTKPPKDRMRRKSPFKRGRKR